MRLLLLCVMVMVSLRASELVLLTENFPPFNYEDTTAPDGIAGTCLDIVKAIQYRVGHQGTISLVNWTDAMKRLKSEADIGLFSTTRTSEREDLFYWVGPLAHNDWSLFALKERGIKLKSLSDAAPYKIGTYTDDACEAFLIKNGLQESLKTTTDDRLNSRKLKMGSIDLWVGGTAQIPFKCKQTGLNPDLVEEVLSINHSTLYLAISKQTNPAVAQRWQEALDALRAEGVVPELPSVQKHESTKK